MFLRALLWQLWLRSAVEVVLWSGRRSTLPEPGPAPIVLAGSLLATGPAVMFVLASFGWWLLTGRGPGMRLVRYDIAGPRQRIRSRSRSGSRPGRA